MVALMGTRTYTKTLLSLALLGLPLAGLGLTTGCATGTDADLVDAPHILALGTYEASLGTSVDVFGTNFPTSDDGRLYLVFDGLWKADDGTQAQVYEEFLLRRLDEGHARWAGFGPYRIPFGSGDRTGTFEGRVGVQFKSRDRSVVVDDAEPREVTFRVKPSLIVHEFQPITANCANPIERGIGQLPYRLRVEAVGFEPETFTYTMQTPALDRQHWSVRRIASGRYDTLGDDGSFVLPAVPNDMQFYAAILTVEGTDGAGQSHKNSFAIGIRRPLEVYYNGNVRTAEYLAPEPQSGCIPGGATSRDFTWSNIKEQSASRSWDVNWQNNWNTTHTVEQGSSRLVGVSVVNGIGFGTTNSTEFSWGTQSEVNGQIGLDTLVKLGIGGRRNYLRDQGISSSNSTERTRTEGVDVSETTTESESVAEAEGGAEGGSLSETTSSSESIGKQFSSQIPANTFATLYTQQVRLRREALLIAYDQCGLSTVAADVNFTDWQWSVDVGQGLSCDPLPASNLPAAQCLIDEECEGEF